MTLTPSQAASVSRLIRQNPDVPVSLERGEGRSVYIVAGSASFTVGGRGKVAAL